MSVASGAEESKVFGLCKPVSPDLLSSVKVKDESHDRHADADASSSTPEPQGMESKNRKYLRERLKGNWIQDPYFLDKHFIIGSPARKYAKGIIDDSYAARTSRWKRIPSNVSSSLELVSVLSSLLNTILVKSNIPGTQRLWLQPDPTTLRTSRHPLPTPALLLSGAGNALLANRAGVPMAQYFSCIVPMQIMLERDFRPTKRHLCAVDANEVFLMQDNRRYIHAAILTEEFLRIIMFDSSGAVIAPALPYHKRPVEFCLIIAGLATLDEVKAGFDTSITLDENMKPVIITKEAAGGGCNGSRPREVVYRIKERLFKASRFIGRATTCWLVASVETDSRLYVIKDAWVALSQTQNETEGKLIDHARQQGVQCGLVRVRHQAKIAVPGRREDSIVKNRRIRSGVRTREGEKVQDRVHTRIVMETCGKPIWHFSSRREFLVAFHDAIQAHKNLYRAGILHRDISVNNILINIDPNAEEGDRGLLIDLDYAVRLNKQDRNPMHIGTTRFMSHRILARERRHTYFDDLESFYYVFCWLICTCNGPRNSHVRTPEKLKRLDVNDRGIRKRLHIQRDFNLPVQPWFGPLIKSLATRLHDYIREDCDAPLRAMDPNVDMDYAEFLGVFNEVITRLGPEDDIDAAFNERSKLAPIENLASSFFKRKADEVQVQVQVQGVKEEEVEGEHPARRPGWSATVDTPGPNKRRAVVEGTTGSRKRVRRH